MNSISMLLIIATALQAQEMRVPEMSDPICTVSDQHIAAATASQKVTLETEACTASLNSMVDITLSDIKKSYAAYYREAHLNPAETDAVSLLLVRRQLLSRGWSAGQVEHFEIDEDSALLGEIDQRLQEYLTPQQMALLKSYEETLPARHLVDPVASRLQGKGQPLSEAQWAEVLPATQQLFADWLKSSRPRASADERQRCMEAHARMNQRDQGIEKILAKSLDEKQLETAQAYYRNLFERRERMLRLYEQQLASGDAAFCSISAN